MDKILTGFQKELLKEIGKSELSDYFVWSGGTALSYKYLRHRQSYDLDFMSKDLFPDDYLLTRVKEISNNLKIKKIEEHKRFNRYEFWLKKHKETVKIEFVFYPFPNVKKPEKNKEFNLKIDSIEDILTNKTHAIFERSEPKDVFDFYFIIQKRKIKFLSVFKWVKKKFGTEIDPVLFAGKVLEGAEKLNEIKPLIFKKEFFKIDKIKNYFKRESQNYLKRRIK